MPPSLSKTTNPRHITTPDCKLYSRGITKTALFYPIEGKGVGKMSQWIKYLPSKHESGSLIPRTQKSCGDMVTTIIPGVKIQRQGLMSYS